MIRPLYASELAAQALNLEPQGTPHSGQDTCCAMCACSIRVGELSAKLRPSQTFTDWANLTPSEHLCGWCSVSTEQVNMRPLQRAVITRDGVYPISTDDHRAWFLLTPPEPPYAVVISNRSVMGTFHLHWRTPVTLDNNLILVRADDQLLHIRRPVLLAAISDAQELATLMHQARAAKNSRTAQTSTARHPFVSLDRSLSDTRHGRLRDDALAAGVHRPELIARLRQLTAGELWALATLAKANTPTPTKPEIITSPKPRLIKTETNK